MGCGSFFDGLGCFLMVLECFLMVWVFSLLCRVSVVFDVFFDAWEIVFVFQFDRLERDIVGILAILT